MWRDGIIDFTALGKKLRLRVLMVLSLFLEGRGTIYVLDGGSQQAIFWTWLWYTYPTCGKELLTTSSLVTRAKSLLSCMVQLSHTLLHSNRIYFMLWLYRSLRGEASPFEHPTSLCLWTNLLLTQLFLQFLCRWHTSVNVNFHQNKNSNIEPISIINICLENRRKSSVQSFKHTSILAYKLVFLWQLFHVVQFQQQFRIFSNHCHIFYNNLGEHNYSCNPTFIYIYDILVSFCLFHDNIRVYINFWMFFFFFLTILPCGATFINVI